MAVTLVLRRWKREDHGSRSSSKTQKVQGQPGLHDILFQKETKIEESSKQNKTKGQQSSEPSFSEHEEKAGLWDSVKCLHEEGVARETTTPGISNRRQLVQ